MNIIFAILLLTYNKAVRNQSTSVQIINKRHPLSSLVVEQSLSERNLGLIPGPVANL